VTVGAGLDDSVAAIRDAVRSRDRIRVVAGGSKPGLSGGGDLALKGLAGVSEYDPQEYTITALATTPVHEVESVLAANGQELPFDPPLAAAGATIGGTVAAGLSGPGRFRFGGVRDFLLGVRFVDGEGALVTGGAKVVKNAAGFDIPKLMVGSLGRFGVLVELTFKVFPRPEAYGTLRVELPSFHAAWAAMQKLAAGPWDLACLELWPPGEILLRVAGTGEAVPARLARLEAYLASDAFAAEVRGGRAGAATGAVEVRTGEDETGIWRDAREFSWLAAGHALVKVAVRPSALPRLEERLDALPVVVPRRYGIGGNVAYLGWPDEAGRSQLERLLAELALPALAITGRWPSALLGPRPGLQFERRLAQALDPRGVFATLPPEGVPGAA
jgi:glycolate oxidase FAD binding subunit